MTRTAEQVPVEQRAASEQAIKKAALRLFSEKGFYSTSTRELTEAAGVSKGTLYWHFRSKEEVAFSLVSDMLGDFLGLVERARDEEGPVIDRMERLVGAVAALYYQETDYLRLLWKFRADRHYIFSPEYTEKVTSYYVRIRKSLESVIEQGIASGEFREVDSKQMAFIMLGITEGLEVEWLENEAEFSMSDALEVTMAMLMDSMRKPDVAVAATRRPKAKGAKG
ncbi:MAG: TetR/AcrR family transcriptional regulator [Actinobacteria bacterium]|nr:TetR/AcrR family transcriptional regulator [Actinomycetota bacterium]MBU1944559.1 TetR/AcrR family transcriptional regulator [Actinomycetota bacterium]MBU2689112.1 TetR/AcrR family transcriptional regulator [Actinomycetota bacterium]